MVIAIGLIWQPKSAKNQILYQQLISILDKLMAIRGPLFTKADSN